MRSVLFVCTGNICRSPTAEAVFRKRVADARLESLIVADSAGTHAYHLSEPPDPRSQAAARARGYDLSRIRARRVTAGDFQRFDLVLAMDREHHHILKRLAPPTSAHKVRLMMSYASAAALEEVPDPYYGGPDGFELVLDLVEAASEGLLEALRAELSPIDR